jgi:hypothetical protein
MLFRPVQGSVMCLLFTTRIPNLLNFRLREFEELKRIGVGAKVDEARRDRLRCLKNRLDWIIDHCGLVATLTVTPSLLQLEKIRKHSLPRR